MNNHQFDFSNDQRIIPPPGFMPVFGSGFADSSPSRSYFNKTSEKRQIESKLFILCECKTKFIFTE